MEPDNNNAEKQQQIMMQLGKYEQQINQINQQLQAIEEAIVEMGNLNFGLDELKGKENKGREVLSPLGRGVFAKTELISDELIVDVGNGNFVKKSIPDTKRIIEEQIKKLETIKKDLQKNLEKINGEMTSFFEDMQNNFT